MNYHQRILRHFVVWTALHQLLCGFVLLGARKATLPATPEAPTVNFVWDGKAPTINEIAKYRDGIYSSLSNTQIMERLLVDAMEVWNAVPGAFIVLNITEATSPVLVEPKDKQNSIVVESSTNLATAAFAMPTVASGSSSIEDCDITIANKAVTAKSLVHTIAHELGHCLGLGHAHTNYNAIMGYSRSRQDMGLGADDIAGLVFLYRDPKYGNSTKSKVCGRIGDEVPKTAGPAWLVLLLALPLAFVRLERALEGSLVKVQNWRHPRRR